MQYNSVDIICKRSKNQWFTIIPLGDIHEGNVGCCLDTLKKEIDYIKNTPNCYWIGMGDMVEGINTSDYRFDIDTIAKKYHHKIGNIVQHQTNTIVNLFKPIAKKCLGLHRGNHETKILSLYHYDILEEITTRLKVTSLLDTALTRLNFKYNGSSRGVTINILSTHGHVAGRKPGNKVNRLTDLMGEHDAEIFLMGHAHSRDITLKNTLYFNKDGKVVTREKIGAITGSFLKGYVKGHPSYVEKFMYPPLSIGNIRIKINPYEDIIEVGIPIKRKRRKFESLIENHK